MTTAKRYLWTVRRELWENRAVYIAPLVVGALGILGFLVTVPTLGRQAAALHGPDIERAHVTVHGPYGVVAMIGLAVAFLIGVFYALDALHGERRDRSVLFWKSLPVSDAVAVLAKASIPLLVLPIVVMLVSIGAQLVMALVTALTFLVSDRGNLGLMMSHVAPFQLAVGTAYTVLVIALWHAPIYAWLLLVSARVRRGALLWAAIPLLAIGGIERILFRSYDFFAFMYYLLLGWTGRAYVSADSPETELLASLAPGQALATPSLWIGLAFAAACVVAAIAMRRRAEPI